MTNTPMSLSTRSSRLSEANTATSRSSLNVPERHELRKSPITRRNQEAAIDSAAVVGGGETNVESTTSTATTHSSKFNGVTFMRPRYSRRVHSKSEPHPTSPASASGLVADNESPAKRTDVITTSERRVSAPVAHGSPGSSLIPKLGIRGSLIAKQPPIPPRKSSDGKCGIFPTTAQRENTEGKPERVPPTVIKEMQEPANLPAVPPSNENQPPSKTSEHQPTLIASRRSIRGIRRLRAGSLRGHRGRVLHGPSPHRSTQE